jgi:hypothetical protein
LGKELKYNFFYRKSSFKNDKENAQKLLDLIFFYKPRKFLEIGVLEGVTSKNICRLLDSIYLNNFNYLGIDLFGTDKETNNISQFTPISNRYSNPFKYIYFNFLLRENPNTIESVRNFLKKYSASVKLYKGYSHDILSKIDIYDVDFTFLDGGHAYETVKIDLNLLLNKVKKGSIVLCDDYNISHYGVKDAVDELKHKYYFENLGRFALLRK